MKVNSQIKNQQMPLVCRKAHPYLSRNCLCDNLTLNPFFSSKQQTRHTVQYCSLIHLDHNRIFLTETSFNVGSSVVVSFLRLECGVLCGERSRLLSSLLVWPSEEDWIIKNCSFLKTIYISTYFTCRSSKIQSVCVAWLSGLVLINWNNLRKTQGSTEKQERIRLSAVSVKNWDKITETLQQT